MKKFILFAAVCIVLLMSLSAFAESGTWKIVFDNDQYAVYVGKQVRITASAEAESGDAPNNLSLIWTSSDETIAKVSNNGTVVGVSGGNATITATARNDESITKSVEVEVRKPVRSVSIEPKTVELTVGAGEDKAVVSMSAIIDPGDAYDQSVVWSIGNESVATVDEKGVVTAHARGNTNLTATSTDPSSQKKATVKIVVSQAVTGIEINPKEIAVPINKSANLKAVLSPADCSNKKVVWSSANEEIATITAGGVVKAVSMGEALITCEAADGSGVKATCKVTVVSPVKKITLSEKSFTLPAGVSYSVTATIEPEDATIKDIVWSSSNEKVAIVDNTGRITGLAPGNATITASAMDGSNAKNSVKVTVAKYDIVFTDTTPQERSLSTSGYGGNGIKVKTKNKIVEYQVSGYSSMVTSRGASFVTSFSIWPVKTGTDVITFSYGRSSLKMKVFVSQDAFDSKNTDENSSDSSGETLSNSEELHFKKVEGMDGATVKLLDDAYSMTLRSSGDPGDNRKAIRFLLEEPVNAKEHRFLSFRIKDMQGSNTHKVTLVDASGKTESKWIDIKSVYKKYERINVPVSNFDKIDLSQLVEIRIGEWNAGEYLFNSLVLCD